MGVDSSVHVNIGFFNYLLILVITYYWHGQSEFVPFPVLIEFTNDLINKLGFVERNLLYLKRTLDFV